MHGWLPKITWSGVRYSSLKALLASFGAKKFWQLSGSECLSIKILRRKLGKIARLEMSGMHGWLNISTNNGSVQQTTQASIARSLMRLDCGGFGVGYMGGYPKDKYQQW